MKVKVKRSGFATWRTLWTARWLLLGLGLLLPERAAHAVQSVHAQRYRDGSAWVNVARTGERDREGRARLELTRGERVFRASVGRGAVVRIPSAALARTLRRHELRLSRVLSRALDLYLVEGRAHEDGADVAARLAQARDVRVAVPDLYSARRRHEFAIPPNDARYGGQWYLAQLGIEDAWRASSGARSVTIAIVDDGCDFAHPDLTFVGGRDVLDGDDDASFAPNLPQNAHGTACSGVAAAEGNNLEGIAGVCPKCSLACVRLIPHAAERLVPISADIAAFEYAFEIGAAVVSNSWGYAETTPVSEPLAAVVERLASQGRGGLGAVVVFAAGNENRVLADDEIMALPGVVTVGAVNNFDEEAPFANYGSALDLSAPTGSLTTDIHGADGYGPGDYTNLFGGTSAACPVVAGVAGLILSFAPTTTARDVQTLLKQTARKAPYATPGVDGHDPVYGYGIVDPRAALRALGANLSAPAPRDAGTPSAPLVDASAPQALDAASPTPAADSAAQLVVDADSPHEVQHPTREHEDDEGCSLGSARPPHAFLLLLLLTLVRRMRARRSAVR